MKKYLPDVPIHVYNKSIDSGVVFYSELDYVLFYTLASCLSRKYDVTVIALAIMPNHFHMLQLAASDHAFQKFNSELCRQFTQMYNSEHGRKGPLFIPSIHCSPKRVGKHVRSCISYICNNPVVGKICSDVMLCRWNCLPYYNRENPFSERIKLNSSSRRFRRAVKMLDIVSANNRPLNYQLQRLLFSALDSSETQQLFDRLITKYSFIDYFMMLRYFTGSFDDVIAMMRVSSGSEYDLDDDWDNYSLYPLMMSCSKEMGITDPLRAVSVMSPESLARYIHHLATRTGATQKHISRFLHLDRYGRGT